MTEDEPEISILDARLAEIDRRLSRIQTGLTEDVDAGGGLSPASAEPRPGPSPVALAPAWASSAHTGRDDVSDDDGPDDDPGLVVAELRGLIADHARLLEAMGELVAAGERIVARAGEADVPRPALEPIPAAPARGTPAPATAAGTGALTVAAGPFHSVPAVRDFERAMRTLPGVDAVELRGYEGGDRAILDVHVSGPTS